MKTSEIVEALLESPFPKLSVHEPGWYVVDDGTAKVQKGPFRSKREAYEALVDAGGRGKLSVYMVTDSGSVTYESRG